MNMYKPQKHLSRWYAKPFAPNSMEACGIVWGILNPNIKKASEYLFYFRGERYVSSKLASQSYHTTPSLFFSQPERENQFIFSGDNKLFWHGLTFGWLRSAFLCINHVDVFHANKSVGIPFNYEINNRNEFNQFGQHAYGNVWYDSFGMFSATTHDKLIEMWTPVDLEKSVRQNMQPDGFLVWMAPVLCDIFRQPFPCIECK